MYCALCIIYCVVGLVFLALWYRKMRSKMDKKNTQLRNDIVANLHDDLSGRLYAIKIISDQIGDPALPFQHRYLLTQNLKVLAESAMQVISNLMWSFKSPNNSLDALINKLQDFSKTTIEPLIFHQITVLISPALLQQTLDSQNANHILMAFQEILINMLKHTHPKRIETLIDLKENTLEIHIWNHLQFTEPTNRLPPLEPSSESYGMKNIAWRLKAMAGTIRFDENRENQHCELKIPLS